VILFKLVLRAGHSPAQSPQSDSLEKIEVLLRGVVVTPSSFKKFVDIVKSQILSFLKFSTASFDFLFAEYRHVFLGCFLYAARLRHLSYEKLSVLKCIVRILFQKNQEDWRHSAFLEKTRASGLVSRSGRKEDWCFCLLEDTRRAYLNLLQALLYFL